MKHVGYTDTCIRKRTASRLAYEHRIEAIGDQQVQHQHIDFRVQRMRGNKIWRWAVAVYVTNWIVEHTCIFPHFADRKAPWRT